MDLLGLVLAFNAIYTLYADVIQPTVSNSTGDYYIADNNASFIDGRIHCNNSTKQCSISCVSPESCTTLFIQSSSPFLSIACTSNNACTSLTVNATNYNSSSSFTAMFADDEAITDSTIIADNFNDVHITQSSCNACNGNKYTLSNIGAISVKKQASDINIIDANYSQEIYDIMDSSSLNYSCIGDYVCMHDMINTNNTNLNLDCHGKLSCYNVSVSQGIKDKNNLICVDGKAVCKHLNLLISPLTDHTHILCNGTMNSESCNNVNITVPKPYENGFLLSGFANSQNDNIPYAGTIDDVTIRCLDSVLCTNYSTFPMLFPIVEPHEIINNNTLIYNGTYAYQYQFRHIICNDSQQCNIHCLNERTCHSTLIECRTGSECNIYCPISKSCDNVALVSYGNNVNLNCGEEDSCSNSNIWITQSYTNENNLNISTCNQNMACDDTSFFCGNSNNFTIAKFVSDGDQYICEDLDCCPYSTINNTISDDSLSAGAIVGIVVGSLIGVGLIIFVIMFVTRRRKIRNQTNAADYRTLN